MINREEIKRDFPQISELYDGKPIVYLDSAATNLKHIDVIKSNNNYYSKETANIHRGIHTLSEIGTEKYEHTRTLLKELINASSNKEIIYTKGTTDSINLVAKSWGENNLGPGDEVLISHMEHHSNIVPWQMVCEKTGAKLKIIPIDDNGDILFDEYLKLLNERTKIVSVVYISNSLGTVNPIDKMIGEARKVNALFLVDAAQAISHKVIDVQTMNCDFLCFSAHKMFGPTGIGALYGKESLLESMPPIFGGGDMIDKVTFEKTTYNTLPYKFEAGTPNISAGISWAPALEYIKKVGIENIASHESELLTYATNELKKVEGLKIIGTAKEKSAVISFTLECCHPHDIATMANKYGVALRTGHHCTQPVMERMNVPATARASFGIYNDKADVDKLVDTLNKIVDLFS